MIKYSQLHRKAVDEYLHWLMFLAYSTITAWFPFSTELRTYVTVLFESAANFCKWCFRPSDESHRIIEALIADFQEAYSEGDQKVAIITGATSGIGKPMAVAVVRAGFHLIMPARNRPKAERVRSEILRAAGPSALVTIIDCDLERLESVRAFAAIFRQMNLPLNLLINNAGVFVRSTRPTADGLEPHMAINHVAHYILVEELLDKIEARGKPAYGCRIINVSSASFYAVNRLQQPELFQPHWWERFAPYARSKLANVLFTVELARRIKSSTATVNCMEPGMVLTDIYRHDPLAQLTFKWFFALLAPFLLLKPEEGAVTAIWLALSRDVHMVTGRVFSDLHEIPLGLAAASIAQAAPSLISDLTQKALAATRK